MDDGTNRKEPAERPTPSGAQSQGQGQAPSGQASPGGDGVRPDRGTPPAGPAGATGRGDAGGRKVSPHLRQEELLRGSRPGDRFIRYNRKAGPFVRKRGGVLAASLETDVPRGSWGRSVARIKRVLIGPPISTEHSIHERLTKIKALAVLSSDPLSSVAYATEEIVRVLVLAGMGALQFTLPVALAVMVLLAIVATSYRQTIAAYPRGGGSYIVAKDNLGVLPGLTAAASILIDYTMTVAVSISAGVFALYSLWPELQGLRVEICLVLVVLITIANLRGVREAGNIFALPTYFFVFGILAMIAYGLMREFLHIGGAVQYVPPDRVVEVGHDAIGIFLLLRAFTQGCTALTGVEAISDGVPAFKPPESKNARTTLTWMAVLAISMFAGITFLAHQIGIMPSDDESVLSQLARNILGRNVLWSYINITTALILILAANTAFSDFPRLSYFLARDKFMPHQYSFRGDRLAYSWGIVTLAVLASILILAFGGDTTALIPLYTVGVFNSFTLSQAGMVVRWWRTRTPGWRRSMAINAMGMVATFLVLIVSVWTKFLSGAWIVIALIPLIILMFLAINRHYRRVSTEVQVATPMIGEDFRHTFIVPVASLNALTLAAVQYARSLSKYVTAVHVVEGEDETEAERFHEEWQRLVPYEDVNLVIIESPYRSLLGPLLSYIDALDQQSPDDTITIVLPEFLPGRPWEYLLHNQTALRLKLALLFRPNTVVASVPYVLGRDRAAARRWMWGLPVGPLVTMAAILFLVYLIFLRQH